ncbi:MAG: S49 family peptidase [Planctomycetales bacterium]|nr:S49 family peptidase [Planctomycetales bacterium]
MLISLTLASGGCNSCAPFTVRTRVVNETTPSKDMSPISEMPIGPYFDCDNRVAIIDVDGLLLNQNMTGFMSVGTNPVADFRAKLDYASRHGIRAVVVRINSSGGSVTASDIMWRELNAFKARTEIPVVACLMDVGAGGGYYLATAADHIVAHPTTLVGGVGVILNLYDMEKQLENFNIFSQSIKAGENTDLGTPVEPISEEGEAILQSIADKMKHRFHDVISSGRGIALSGDESFLDGRVITSDEALAANLIDTIGYLDDAIELASQLSSCKLTPVVLHRCDDVVQTAYGISPNNPSGSSIISLDIPGIKRSKLPLFLYIWQPDPTIEP